MKNYAVAHLLHVYVSWSPKFFYAWILCLLKMNIVLMEDVHLTVVGNYVHFSEWVSKVCLLHVN